jgi:hypothetical protein
MARLPRRLELDPIVLRDTPLLHRLWELVREIELLAGERNGEP